MSRLSHPWLPPIVIAIALALLGAQSPPAFHLMLVLVSMTFLVMVARAVVRDGLPTTTERLFAGTSPLLLLALPLYASTQLAAQATLRFSDGATFATATGAMELAALAMFYLLVRHAVTSASDFRLVLGALALVGGVEALYGLLNLLAGNESLLLVRRQAYLDSATGTLVSRNHFAFLLEMLLPAALAFAVVFARPPGHSRQPVSRSDSVARITLVYAVVVVSALGLLFSRSRMGIASLAAAMLVVAVAARAMRPRDDTVRARTLTTLAPALVGVLAVVLVGVLALAIGLDPLVDRFVSLDRDLEAGRLPIWRATLAMFWDQPLIGHGWGTFRDLLPGYRPLPTGYYYTHAHNDYFEILADGGLVGLILAGSLIACFARRLRSALALPLRASERTVILWLAVAIVSVLLHSLADHGLRTTAVAFTFVAMTALFARVTEEPALVSGRPSRRRSTAKEHR